MATLFTKIRSGEIPGCVLTEDAHSFAIVDKYPVQPGHILVIPKREVPTLDDLPEDEYIALMIFSRTVAAVLAQITQAPRIGRLVEGFGVPDHAHLHLIPLTEPNQMDMSKSFELPEEEMAAFAEEFHSAWEAR
jgi:histidine triad (HIT) family protein